MITFLGLNCVAPTYKPPFYQCVPCRPGYHYNGTTCVDTDECQSNKPCDPRAGCTNLKPGFRCGACPLGFNGTHVQGIQLNM